MLIYKFFNTLTNFLKWSFILGFSNLCGNEIGSLYSEGGKYDYFSTTSFVVGAGSTSFQYGTNSHLVSSPSPLLLATTSSSFPPCSVIAFTCPFRFCWGCPGKITAGALVDSCCWDTYEICVSSILLWLFMASTSVSNCLINSLLWMFWFLKSLFFLGHDEVLYHYLKVWLSESKKECLTWHKGRVIVLEWEIMTISPSKIVRVGVQVTLYIVYLV